MQYNFPHFSINRTDFLKGGNTYNNYPDGGFQYDYVGYNAFSKPGWLGISQDIGNSVTSSLPINIGISWGFGKGVLAQEVVAVGSNSSQDGSFWTMNESTGGLTQVGSDDTAHDYQLGFTSTIFYHGAFYTTSKTDITYQLYDLSSRDVAWWVTTKGQSSLNGYSPHPQVVFGDIHYIADGQYIHQNDNGTVTAQVLDLGADWVITEMVVYNNLIYITAEPYYNFSGTKHGLAKMFTWNGYADSWLDEYHLDSRVSAMYVFKNVLYVWNSKYIGYFTGSTIKNLYPVSGQIYSSQICSTADSMWFIDGSTVVRYGSPYLSGQFKFHRFFSLVSNGNGMCSPQTESLLIATTGASNGSNFFVSNVNGGGGGNKSFKMNTRRFIAPVHVRGYVIDTDGMASGQYVEVGLIDDTGTLRGTKRFGYSVDAAMQGKQRWTFDIFSVGPSRTLTPYITVAGGVYLQGIDFLYEPSEDKLNK